MHNQERAEKIWSNLADRSGSGVDSWDEEFKDEFKRFITSHLDEAVREAFQEGIAKEREDCSKLTMPKVGDIHRKDGFAKGFASAKEQAAGIALNAEIDGYDDEANEPLKQMFPMMQKQIAERIRAMEADK